MIENNFDRRDNYKVLYKGRTTYNITNKLVDKQMKG